MMHDTYTGYTQKNGAVSKVNKKFISHLTRAQRTPSAAAAVQVSHACVFSKPCTKLTMHCNHRFGHLKTEHTESFFMLRRHLGNWPRGPAVSMRNELLVAHEKLGQLPLLTVYVVPHVRREIIFLLTFETAPFFCVYLVYLSPTTFYIFRCLLHHLQGDHGVTTL